MIFILCSTVGIIHLGITLWLAIAQIRYRSKKNSEQNSLSIVIAARDEESNLKTLIPALLKQDYDNFEIIIALDRCSDLSEDYLNSINDSKLQFIPINKVQDNWNSKKYALNQAINKAGNNWLIFTDADCEPASDQWLKMINNQITDRTDIGIGVSPYRNNGSFLSCFIQFEAFMTAFLYVARALTNRPYMAVGRNMAVRKSYFKDCGGYESCQAITGGDDDLFIQKNANKENCRVVLGKGSLVYTIPKKTWKEYWNQKTRHLSVGYKYKASDRIFLGFFHFTHLSFLVGLLFSSTHAFFLPMLLFYLFIKLVSYRFAAGKMEININYMLLPFVDMLYAVLIPVVALWSKLEKDIKWKN